MQPKQKPRELSNRYGYTALATDELLALILQHGTKARSVFSLSNKLAPLLVAAVQKQRKTADVLRQPEIVSLGAVKRHQVLALYELLLRQTLTTTVVPTFTSPRRLAEQFHHLTRKRQEYVYGVYLSPRLAIVHTQLLTKGTTDSVTIDPRDVLYYGIKYRVRHIVLVHNHPTGVPMPSGEDTEVTKKLVAAANLMSMQLLDHIIVARQGYYSFKESSHVI